MLLVTAAQMREMDRATIEDIGVPGVALMENAGKATADLAWEAGVLRPGDAVAVMCGPGNNGGDGFVVARHLANRGCEVRTFLLADPDKVRGDAKLNLDAWRNQGGAVEAELDADWIDRAPLRIDALLGTGLTRDVGGPIAAGVDLLNDVGESGFTVAVDIPSGLCADTGQVLGRAVRADLTVTYGHPKRGHFLFPGADLTGQLEVVDIGIPPSVTSALGVRCEALDDDNAVLLLPGRPVDGHKGTFGHVLVVAGSPGKAGAAVLTAKAALRSGAGLVTLASDGATRQAAVENVPEVMTTEADVRAAAEGKAAVACGPGLGFDDDAVDRVLWAAGPCPLPTVLDADALTILADGRLGVLADAAGPRVLTPHPGEMARLLGASTEEVQADRIGAAARFAQEHGVVCLLKGAHTLVATPDGAVTLTLTGGPALATGGSGDVLTGLVAALLAHGRPPAAAAIGAAWLHGRAGDLAAEELGEVSVMAGDVADRIGRAWP